MAVVALKVSNFAGPCAETCPDATFNRDNGQLHSVRAALEVPVESQLVGFSQTTRMSLADRRAVVEILRATKRDLPAYVSDTVK